MKFAKKMGILVIMSLGCIGTWKIIKKSGETIERKNKEVDKYKSYYYLYNKWMRLKESGKRLESYFKDNKIEYVALYGLSDIGLNLYDELMKDGIKVLYAMDRSLIKYDSEIPIKKLDDDLEQVDAVIVTVVDEFDAIKSELSQKFTCPILSLEDVIYSV